MQLYQKTGNKSGKVPLEEPPNSTTLCHMVPYCVCMCDFKNSFNSLYTILAVRKCEGTSHVAKILIAESDVH